MTTLEKLISDRGVSLYAISKELGLDPASTAGIMSSRIKGGQPMKKETFDKIIEAIEKISGEAVDREEIEVDAKVLAVQ